MGYMGGSDLKWKIYLHIHIQLINNIFTYFVTNRSDISIFTSITTIACNPSLATSDTRPTGVETVHLSLQFIALGNKTGH